MRRWFDKKRQNNRGFTLVELVIVIAILAILVGLLAPQYTNYVERTRKSADVENLEEMVKAFQVAVADEEVAVPTGSYSVNIAAKTTFYGPGGAIEAETDATYGELYAAMCETLGETWLETSLKSSVWGTNGLIYATLEVGDNGSVSVEYVPAQLKELTKAS